MKADRTHDLLPGATVCGKLSLYVTTDNPTAAEKLGSDLLDQALSLESLPFRGSQVRKRPGYLKLVHGNYLIYYRIKEEEKVVEVLRFVHGALAEHQ